jgi:hypothetical protein
MNDGMKRDLMMTQQENNNLREELDSMNEQIY